MLGIKEKCTINHTTDNMHIANKTPSPNTHYKGDKGNEI